MLSLLLAAAIVQTPLPLNIGGRVAPASNGAYDFGWPGVYFEGRFTGPSVEVAVDTGVEAIDSHTRPRPPAATTPPCSTRRAS